MGVISKYICALLFWKTQFVCNNFILLPSSNFVADLLIAWYLNWGLYIPPNFILNFYFSFANSAFKLRLVSPDLINALTVMFSSSRGEIDLKTVPSGKSLKTGWAADLRKIPVFCSNITDKKASV